MTVQAEGRLTRAERRALTRRELLDAAASVFAKQGYHAASVDDVAEAAGYTKGAVYSNFESKEELFLALYEEHVQRAVSAGEELLDLAPEERATEFAQRHATMEIYQRDWFLLEIEFLLYAARNDSMRARVAVQQAGTRERVAAIVRQHMADVGALNGVAPEDVARLIIAAADGLTIQELIEGVDQARLLALLVDLLSSAARATP